MKTKVLLFVSIVGLSALTVPSAAQVKIGTNPTTIESGSNLEVEASTAGRKMKVNKATGQVTIADGTQGTGKILVSDSSGGASWKTPIENNISELVLSARRSDTLQPTGTNYVPSIPLVSGSAANYNATTSVYTVPVAGFYNYNFSLEVLGTVSQIFTVQVDPLDIEDGPIRGSSTTWNTRAISGAKWFEAGETISLSLGRAGGVPFDSNWKLRKLAIVIFRN